MDISKLIPPTKTMDECYKQGYNCGLNGATTTNCHFSLFATPDKTARWEVGKRDGKVAKQTK